MFLCKLIALVLHNSSTYMRLVVTALTIFSQLGDDTEFNYRIKCCSMVQIILSTPLVTIV